MNSRREFLDMLAKGTALITVTSLLSPLYAGGGERFRRFNDPGLTGDRQGPVIKMTMMLRRNQALSHEQFVKHHIEKHGPLFRQIPEARRHVIRYLQTHPIPAQTRVLKVDDFDGTAELWFDNLAGLEAVLTAPFYREKVWPDELTFLDHANTLVMLGYQDDIMGKITEIGN